ncbi:MAG: N-6 DNA methylase [Bacillota bacterium]
MSIGNVIKRIQDIMRQDAGVDGDAQRISQLVWLLFLKIYDAKEQEEWEVLDENYISLIPENLKWRNWAIDDKTGSAMTGEELLNFVNIELFPTLKSLEIDEYTDKRNAIVKEVFEDAYNYQKNGILLRQVINVLNEMDFGSYEERHTFNDVYETILKDLQSAGNAGEFYTPRPCTDFIIEMLNPKVGEIFRDDAAGTGGFLISALEHLKKQAEYKTVKGSEAVKNGLRGTEKKPMPHLLCMTNLILHDIDVPLVKHGNSLEVAVREIPEEEKADVIATNPPYGGIEEITVKNNFPVEFRSSETADLFMALYMFKLKLNGRAGVVLPNSFLFYSDGFNEAVKKKLLKGFNVHTILRFPKGVFEPYTDIETNIIFFDNNGHTSEVWYFEHPLPQGYKNYTKTRPLKIEEFELERSWWNNRIENENAWVVSLDEIINNKYSLDFKNPNAFDLNIERISIEKQKEYVDKTKNDLGKEINSFKLILEQELNVELLDSSQKRYKFSDFLKRVKEGIDIEDNSYYKRVTIRTKNLGISLRDEVVGTEIGTKRQFIVKKGQFLLSKIDASNGAFGIVPQTVDDAIITGNFWTYEIDENIIEPKYLNLLVSLPEFIDICKRSSSGTTNRRYLDEAKFLDFEIQLPVLSVQKDIVNYYLEKEIAIDSMHKSIADLKKVVLFNPIVISLD